MRSVAVTVILVVGCTDQQSRQPPEPTDSPLACAVVSLVCHLETDAPVLDRSDPLWPFCATYLPHSPPYQYASGVAEIDIRYDDTGGIDEIAATCSTVGTQYLRAERDGDEHVVRWRADWWARAPELTYDDAGELIAVHVPPTPPLEQESTTTFTYNDRGRVVDRRTEVLIASEPQPDSSYTLRLEHDPEGLVRATLTSDGGMAIAGYKREGGRVRRFWFESAAVPDYEIRYRADGEHVVGSEMANDDVNIVARYKYDEAGRLAEIERDLDSEPWVTAWLDYDAAGRLGHVTWWGHLATGMPSE